MDLALLEKTLAEHDEPRFRARQVWAWAARGAQGYEEMTDLPAGLRDALARELPFSSLSLQQEARASDGTVKALFATADGRALEAVRLRANFIWPVAQNVHVSGQLGCGERQIERRPSR
jgi:23S rRNA (adenine2503-C2)-methyltransferase